MNISKKLISYILIGFLCFSSCSITYYKSVHAFEWVEVGISTAEALKWLLGALGIVATGSAAIDNFWEGYEEEFYDYASDDNVSGPDVRAWLEKLAKGTLDKGSQVWDVFRSWASTLVTENSGGSGGSVGGVGTNDFNSLYQALCADFGVTPISVDFSYLSNYNCYGAVIWNNYTGANNPSYMRVCFLLDDYNYTLQIVGNNNLIRTDPQTSFHSTTIAFSNSDFYVENSSSVIVVPYDYSKLVYWGNISVSQLMYITDISELDYGTSSGSLDTINDARQDQFDLINRNTGNEVEQEVAIPMPGVASGDDTISQDSYAAIMDRVESGEISIDDAISEIQEVLQVLVYDTESDDVIPISPDPDDPNENQKKDDVLKEEKENIGFTLAGLENVFPFCIPWDIYAFLNILDADPVAPVFNIPFPNVDDPEHPLTTQVDLSSWDDAMRIVRLAQDFLFIIGLAFLTRSMIGAGGGD